MLPQIALVGEVSNEESLAEAHKGEKEFHNPKGKWTLNPDDGVPMDDGILHKLLCSLLPGNCVCRVIVHFTPVTTEKSAITSLITFISPCNNVN